jgi:hypothetical protein
MIHGRNYSSLKNKSSNPRKILQYSNEQIIASDQFLGLGIMFTRSDLSFLRMIRLDLSLRWCKESTLMDKQTVSSSLHLGYSSSRAGLHVVCENLGIITGNRIQV